MNRPIPISLIISALVFFALQGMLVQSDSAVNKKYLAPPPQYLEYFTFGFSSSMADSFWLRWIQDGDVCQTYGEEFREHPATVEPKSDRLVDNPRHRVCDFSWSYQMLDAVTKLDPRFKMPYQTGLVVLSVMVEDYQGATALYERALKAYPEDWQLAYQAAYHFLFDLQDMARAAKLLDRAADLGAPSWVKSLASRLYTRTGQLQLGISSLESYLKTVENEKDKEKVEARLAALRLQADQGDKGP